MDSLNNYFEGAVAQHLVRGTRLLERIPKNLPREFQLLAQTCDREIQDRLAHLTILIRDPQMKLPQLQPERLRRFRRIVSDLNHYETIGITALERHNEDDIFLNKLIERICREIAYPLFQPVVTSLSQSYFHIYSDLNLMFVPLSESDFLLHLPDLYHELAHPFLYQKFNPHVVPFQNEFFQVLTIIMQYIHDELDKENSLGSRRPSEFRFYLQQWQRSWKDWLTELFCDLFATATVGPAFAWSHLHLYAKLGSNPFHVPTWIPTTHPADDARMQVMLLALKKLGFSQEVKSLQNKWEDFLTVSGAASEPEYIRCFPSFLLNQIVDSAIRGISGMKCRIAQTSTDDPIYRLLNQAWTEFWNQPSDYVSWEKQTKASLRGLCGVLPPLA